MTPLGFFGCKGLKGNITPNLIRTVIGVRLLNAWNGVGGGLALRRFGVRLLNRVYFAPCVYPPLRGVCDLVENPYIILYVYITIISGRNKYLKISKGRQVRLAPLYIQWSC